MIFALTQFDRAPHGIMVRNDQASYRPYPTGPLRLVGARGPVRGDSGSRVEFERRGSC